ncbi:AAA family ATPase [Ceratobasidium sp. AG-Ba]|nr:AAA family ATPase [Ceratobasidium sp. AG-Ba]QRW09476.1 AAA family ATPase [Ceratobasidium sp. AG-Ba]
MFSVTQAPLKQLIEDAGAQFRARDLTGITIYMADQYGNWKRLTSKPHRNYASVVLEPKMKDDLFGDVKEFLEGKEWYAQRGIPYRRGYLLFGTPGSGKTSSIHALASELGLDIYIVPLSLRAIDDAILSDLITSMPQACILLYEDIDAAFGSRTAGEENAVPPQSGVTLSGLLNTIDGVQAQEGCLLFATTNHPEHLDPALIRPGRMDIKIEYRHATQWQAEQLFRLFYPVESSGEKLPVERAARAFAQSIPESRLSVAQLQGFLMRFKGHPEDAARDAKSWVEVELAGAS